jgi:hypothetical protein
VGKSHCNFYYIINRVAQRKAEGEERRKELENRNPKLYI